jgi:hypothetical protein
LLDVERPRKLRRDSLLHLGGQRLELLPQPAPVPLELRQGRAVAHGVVAVRRHLERADQLDPGAPRIAVCEPQPVDVLARRPHERYRITCVQQRIRLEQLLRVRQPRRVGDARDHRRVARRVEHRRVVVPLARQTDRVLRQADPDGAARADPAAESETESRRELVAQVTAVVVRHVVAYDAPWPVGSSERWSHIRTSRPLRAKPIRASHGWSSVSTS